MQTTTTSESEPFQVPRWLEIILVASILLVAIILRVVALRSFPPGLRYDELVNATGVDQVLREGPTIYFTSGWGHEPLFQHVAAVVWRLAGRSAVTFRLTAALFGILGVLAGWMLARRLFGSWVALLTMAALASTFVPLLFARLALRVIALPLFTALSVYALWRALDLDSEEPGGGRPALWFTAGGLALGLALLTYPAARVLPFVLLAFLIYLAIFHRDRLQNRWWGVLLFFGPAVLLSGPMFLYLRANPEAEQRLQQLSGLIGTLGQGDVAPLIVGIRKSLTMFVLEGDPEWYYNFAGRPFFPLPVAILFFLGLALAIWRWRRPAYALVLLLLLAGLIPGMASSTNPGFSRTINILPVVYVFPALALVAVTTWIARHWKKGRYLIVWAVAALALLYFAADAYAYFGLWAQHPEARLLHGPNTLELAEYLEAHPQIENIAISAPGVNYYDPWDLIQMELLLTREGRIRWFNGSNSLIVPATPGPVTYFFRDDAPLNDNWEPLLAGDQNQNVANLDDGELSHFSVRVLQDPAKAGNRLLASAVAGEPVQFADLVTFLGQSKLENTYLPGEAIRLTTVWQANKAALEPLIAFLHLLNDQGESVASWDKLDVAPEYWGQGDVFALNQELVVPEDAPPGMYQVTAGWYSPVTGDRLLTGEGDDNVLLGDIEIGGS